MSVKLEPSVIFSNGTDTTEIHVADIVSMQIAVGAPKVVNIGLSTALNSYAHTAVDAGSALRIVQQISDVRNGVLLAGRSDIVDVATTYTIDSIYPTYFDLTKDVVTITGSGFLPGIIGKLYIEDITGGTDSNGYNMICTYVMPGVMTASFGSLGDTFNTPGAELIYYQDSLGFQSNVINGTLLAGGYIITIP